MRNEKQLWAGGVFFLIGLLGLSQIPHYSIGRPTDMGPGYFPLLISCALVLLGLTASLLALVDRTATPIGQWPLIQLALVTCGVLAFAFFVERAGLAFAVLLLVASTCWDRLRSRPIEVGLIYIVVLALTAAIFLYGIRLPIALL